MGNRDGQTGLGQHATHMSGHIIGAFGGMLEEGIAVGNQTGHKAFQIAAYRGIGIFTEHQGGAGVMDEYLA